MTYKSLTAASTIPVQYYIDKKLVHNAKSNFFQKEILSRGLHLLLVPASVIPNALDIIIGLGASLGAIMTLGQKPAIIQFAYNHLVGLSFLISFIYKNALQTMNPHIIFGSKKNASSPWISCIGNGLVTDEVHKSMEKVAITYRDSHSLFKKHIASRLSYVLLAAACLVTRAIDGALGALAAIFSLITIGKIPSINNIAVRGLQAPAIILDLFGCTIYFINPWTKS